MAGCYDGRASSEILIVVYTETLSLQMLVLLE